MTHRFYLVGALGIILVLLSSSAALYRTYVLAYDGKKIEVRHLVETAASTVQAYIDRAKKGELTQAEAQRLAADAIKSARFEGGNFIFIARWDGMSIATAPANLTGTNRFDEKDGHGDYFYRAIIDAGKQPGGSYITYWLPFPGQTEPEMKISYVIGFPDWQWSLGTGLFIKSVNAAFAEAALDLAYIIVPVTLLFTFIFIALSRDGAKLLHDLTQSMKRVAAGDLQAEIAGQSRRDEIGEMATALTAFRDAARDKLRLERETEAQRQTVEAERHQVASTIQASADASAHVVDVLAQGLTKLSGGDLTARIDELFAADYEKLRADFNATAASLQAAMRSIAETAGGISSGSGEIAAATDDLSRRTEQQAANVEQTAAALNLITGTVKAMAEGAHEAASVVADARGAAETSGTVVTEAVGAMGKIQESSNQISNIIGVIDEIAFQTNLLALNAGVEAARAGEAGRGFAVVAAEVRALAQRSAEAAKQIKALISASSAQVESGVDLVGKTGDALKDIIDKVAALDGLVRQISSSSQEQATGLGEINTALTQMDQAVQQNAAFVEESTAAAHSLKDEAHNLMELVRRFQTGEQGYKARSPGPAAQFKGSARTTASPAKPTPPARIAKAAGGANNGWEEF